MATYNGTNGDDVINAATGSNQINAGNGNNRVTTGDGNQNVTAGKGNDTITTGAGNDTINAGNGTNQVTTGTGNDTITTGTGNDTINAGDGRNWIDAGNGTNSVTTGSGDDEIRTGTGNDTISAGDGANLIYAGEGHNLVNGGSGNDTIVTGAGNDTINAGGGNNSVDAGTGTNVVNAGSGNDTITTGAGNDTINAGDGRNIIDAGDGANTVNTGRGDDDVDTGAGNDTINAGDGRNIIHAGDGRNTINTGSGADDIFSGSGDDQINAGEGVNRIDAGNGDNRVTSGASSDTITTGSGGDAIYAGEGHNIVNAGNGNNAVYAGAGNDSITTGNGTDVIYAGEGNNVVNAGDGLNLIYTGSGADRINTGSGSDIVYSGDGNDVVDLGGGSDLVYLDGGNDTIRHVVSDNIGDHDVYWGGSGTDTLQLVLTAEQARNAAVISDIQRFQADPSGQDLWGFIFGFQFTAFDLNVRDFEKLEIIAPVDAVNDSATVNEDGQTTIAVLANDVDLLAANNGALRVTGFDATGVPGTLTLANNQFTFVPGAAYQSLAAGETATVSFTYTIGDDQGFSDTATVTLTITGSNDGPVAVADTAATTENQAVTVDVLANDTDVDHGHVFTLLSAAAPNGHGAASVVNNQLVFTPGSDFDHLAAGATKTVTLTYTMRDEFGAQSSSTVTVTVTGTNDGPVAVADAAAGTENQLLVVDVLANDTDLDDGHAFTLLSATAPTGLGTASVAGKQLVFTPGTDFDHLAAGATQVVTLTYTMRDEFGAQSSATVTVTVTGTNDGPVAMADAATGTENQILVVDVLANDTDLDDGHVFTLLNATAPVGLGTASVTGNQLVFAPGSDFDHLAAGATATVVVSYTMADEFGAQSSSTATITITGTNDGPVAVADMAAGTENQTLVVDVLANDTDLDDGATFTLLAASAPNGQGVASIAGNQLVFTPGTDFDHLAAGATATVAVSYTMADEHGAQSTSTATITITGTNDGPVAVADTAAGTENQVLVVDVLANDTDLDDGHVFTLLSATAPTGLGTASIASNQLVFTPGTDFDHLAAGATATVVVSYTMTDEFDAQSTSTATITITGTNDGPIAVADTAAGTENQVLVVDVLANDTDRDDGATFTLLAASAPNGQGVASIANNQLVFTPGTDFDHLAVGETATVTLRYTMADDQGAESVSTVTVTVTGTNDAPVAVADTAAGTENQTLVVDVLANDTDVDHGAVFTLVAAAAPTGQGVASIANNQLVFVPGADFDHLALGATQVVTLTYTMADEHGATSTATVSVTITGTNDGPVAVADVAAGTENQTLTLDVLANDTDLDDGHAFTLLGAGAPAGKGLAAVVNNQLVFAPGSDFDHLAAGATETVTLAYTMRDEHGATSTATVTVTVTGTNDAPVAGFDSAATTENAPVTIDVLANDTDVDDGAVLAITGALVQPGQGSVAVVNNQLVYAPAGFDHLAEGATETVTIFYSISDGKGGQSAATATVTVTGTNDAPVAVADSAAITENQAVSVDVLANDTDLDDGHAFTLLSAAAPGGHGVAAVVNNQLVFTPGTDFDHLAAGATETVTLNYTMADEHGGQSSSAVTITVTGTNDAPVAVADTASAIEDTMIAGSVAANDSDVDDGAVLSYALNAPVAGLSLNADGSYSFDASNTAYQNLAQGEVRTVTAGYTVTDEHGAATTASLTITLTGTNDAPIAVADSVAVLEDSSVTGNLRTNDMDVDSGAVLSYALNAPVAGLTLNANGSYSFNAANAAYQALAQGEVQTVVAGYTVTDQFGATSNATLTIAVTGRNDGPVATIDTATAIEDGAIVRGNVGVNDTDVDHGAVLSYAATNSIAGLTINPDGSYAFDPSNAAYQNLGAGATRVVTGTYRVTDQYGTSSNASLAITVTGTNDAPVVGNVTLLANRLGNGGFDATPNFAGWTINTSSTGTSAVYTSSATIDRTGTVIPGDNAVAVLNYDASTSSFGTGYGPSIKSDPFAGNAGDTVSFTYKLSAGSDQAVGRAYIRDAVTGQIVQTIFNYQVPFVGSTGVQTVNVVLANSGSYTIDFQVGSYDATGGTAIGARLDIGFAGILANGISEDQPFTFANGKALLLANATDVDVGDVLTIAPFASTSMMGASVTLGADGKLVIDPTGAAQIQALAAGETATDSFTYTVSDGHGGFTTGTASYTLTGSNDAPVARADSGATGENQTLTLNVLANDTDVDHGAVLTLISGSIVAGKGSVAVAGNQLVFTPGSDFDHLAAGATETVVLVYTIRDEKGATSTATAMVTVTGTNDGPVATSSAQDASGAVVEAGSLNNGGTPAATGMLTASDLDDGATTTWSGDAAGSYGSFAIGADGRWTYTLDNAAPATQALVGGQVVTETFTATVTDEHGATATQVVTVQVTGADDNQAPTVQPFAASNIENSVTTGLFMGSDPEGGPLTFQVVTPPAGGTVTNNNDGTFLFDTGADFDHLAAGEQQVVTFTYQATDNQGAASAPGTVTITLTGTNDGPVVTSSVAASTGIVVEAGSLDDGTPATGTPLASGTLTASDADDHATATWSLASGTGGGAYGTFAIGADGQWTYTLDNSRAGTQALAEGQTVTETFNVKVTDDQGATATQSVVVTVTGTNDAPVAVADSYAGGSGAATVLGGEILVNTTTVNAQLQPAITALSNGGFVVTWMDNSGAGGDASSYGIKAQLFGASGAKVGGEFLVNTQTSNQQYQPQVSALANGGFVVTWSDSSLLGGDSSGYGIKAQLFGASGAKVGGEFLVNTTITSNQTESSVTGLSNGGFVVTWSDASLSGGDPSGQSVKAQLFSAAGTKIGGEFLVNTQTTNTQFQSNVTALASGGFVVTWADNSLNSGDPSGYGVKAQIYSASGAKVGGEFLVNTQTASTQYQPVITSLASGGFVVAWSDSSTAGGDPSGYGIKAQIYSASGVKTGGEFLVNTTTTNSQVQPAISAVSGGGFIVSWTDGSLIGADTSSNGIKAQLFSATGTKVGGEFLVNTTTANSQDDSAVTFINGGSVAVVWADTSQTGADPSSSGVKLRLYSVESALTENATATVDVLANDTDVDAGKVLTLTSVSAPEGHGVASIVGNKLVFTPGTDFDHLAAGATETVVVSYTVTDDKGATATSTATLTITGTNDAPRITSSAAAATGSVVEAGVGTPGVPTATGTLTSADVDDGATAAWSVANGGAGTYGNLTVDSAGHWTYTLDNSKAATQALDSGEAVTDSITVTVTDEKGASASQLVTVNIAGSNDAPVAAGAAALPGNTTLVANRLTNGDFASTPDFTGWTVNTTSTGTSSASSQVTINRAGTLIAGDNAVASLVYSGQVPVGYGTGYGPTITSNAFQGLAGDTIRFVYVLASGGDQAIGTGYIRDAGTGQIVQTIFNYQVPFTGSTGTQTVEVTLAQSGNYTIDFRVGSYDATGGQAIGASLYVGTAQITSTGIAEDTPYANTSGRTQLLANITDPDGDTLTLSPFTTTSLYGASVVLAANGTLTIDARAAANAQALSDGEKATDSFTYIVSDGHGGTVTNTATYTLIGTNDAPVAARDFASGHQNDVVTLDVLANDVDVDHGAVLTVTSVTAPSKGSVSIVNNQLVFNPNGQFNNLGWGSSEQVSVTYTVKDQFNATSTATASFLVLGAGIELSRGTTAPSEGQGALHRIDATHGLDLLHGTLDNDVFVFAAGTANGDQLFDFDDGDSLAFLGYGEDASFEQIDDTHAQITYDHGASHEVITFDHAVLINPGDVFFG